METLAISFPVKNYDRSKLDALTENELLQLAEKDQHCTIETLGQFQQDLNDDWIGIDAKNNWWYFVNNGQTIAE